MVSRTRAEQSAVKQEVKRGLSFARKSYMEGEHVDFMKYVVGTHQLSRNEIVDNIIEVFMGGIDTVSGRSYWLNVV